MYASIYLNNFTIFNSLPAGVKQGIFTHHNIVFIPYVIYRNLFSVFQAKLTRTYIITQILTKSEAANDRPVKKKTPDRVDSREFVVCLKVS